VQVPVFEDSKGNLIEGNNPGCEFPRIPHDPALIGRKYKVLCPIVLGRDDNGILRLPKRAYVKLIEPSLNKDKFFLPFIKPLEINTSADQINSTTNNRRST
jgi:hypothetical protein